MDGPLDKNDDNEEDEEFNQEWQLDDLQMQTLSRIASLCPKPSKTVIDMISHQMKLSRSCVIDFFVHLKKKNSESIEKKRFRGRFRNFFLIAI